MASAQVTAGTVRITAPNGKSVLLKSDETIDADFLASILDISDKDKIMGLQIQNGLLLRLSYKTLSKEIDGKTCLLVLRKNQNYSLKLSLQNNWVQYDLNSNYKYGTPKAFKNGNIVYLQGLVKDGNPGSVIATLPDKWRPNGERIFAVQQNSQVGRVNVLKSGAIVAYKCVKGWLSLDGINYIVE